MLDSTASLKFILLTIPHEGKWPAYYDYKDSESSTDHRRKFVYATDSTFLVVGEDSW